ncbi:MAG: calcium-translocating P-type ATPase, PMCA-type [Candidatus Zixiibacteriota bacterium]|jgi:Ca2+-transporting ATPase
MGTKTGILWHSLNPAGAAEELETSTRRGLTVEEAAARLSRYGANALEQVGARNGLKIFLSQFTEFLVLVLVAACIVSAFLGEFLDAGAILAIVILNGVLGFVQEFRAEKSLQALREMAAPRAAVVRDGREEEIDTRDVVPGDLVRLRSGDRIPADLRLVEGHSLQVDEAALTGESLSVEKDPPEVLDEDMPLADRRNMAYTGTVVTYGRGDGVVVATGMDTELGRIAAMVQEVGGEQTPLQQRLARLGKFLVWAVLALCGIVFAAGIWRGVPVHEMFLTAVSLAVAAIPEGLPAVVTIALALGVQRMVKRHALIRRLSSVETLGSTSVICSDKTGTLTQNKMVARRAYVNGRELARDESPEDLKPLLTSAFICTEDFIGAATTGTCDLEGSHSTPTEAALVDAALAVGVDPTELVSLYEFVDEVPFDSRRKRMTAVFRREGAHIAFTKGAPEILLELCSAYEDGGEARPLTPESRAALEDANADLAARGLRVIAVATRELPAELEVSDEVERDLTFAGFVAIEDPPRPEVFEAVRKCRLAHITPIMATGDHRATAAAIAREVDILREGNTVLTGRDIDELSDEGLIDELEDARVLARVTPEHKLRVVRALRARGAVVAMTGDGVNDAPALKESDIGVAMGITGTDVSKEASDMILTDDNFATIVAAVEEGRSIYSNIKKFIHFLLSCNTSEILVMFIATLAGWPLPLLPIQILWVNLITDGAPALALGVDPPEVGLLLKPPRPKSAFLFDRHDLRLIPVQGFMIAAATLGSFLLVLYVFDEGLATARTFAFSVLTLSQLAHALNCRSQTRSFFALGPFSNPWLLAAVGFSLLLHLGVVYLPFLEPIFHTVPLSVRDWALMLAFSALPLVFMEIYKPVYALFKRIRREPEDYFGVFPE